MRAHPGAGLLCPAAGIDTRGLWGQHRQDQAAYRFLSHPSVDLDTLLASHIEATARRMQAHPVVLAVQDTTSLNYHTHPAPAGLGPINTHSDGAQGLKLHDTVAFTPEGVPLGVIDVECWAREAIPDEPEPGAKPRRGVEQTEALRWLTSYVQCAPPQALVSHTRVVSVADRGADICELLEQAQQTPDGPDLLIRANRSRARRVDTAEEVQPLLWEHLAAQPAAGTLGLHVPGKGGRRARTAELIVRHTRVTLPPPRGKHRPALALWAVQTIELTPPPETPAVE